MIAGIFVISWMPVFFMTAADALQRDDIIPPVLETVSWYTMTTGSLLNAATWRAKGPKTVVSRDLENPPKPPKNEFAESCCKSNSILKLEHFLKPCVQYDYKEKEKMTLSEVI
ncbi:hypothetical protein pdam_00000209 [Pocillopora damicornis]|uniref:G-protein coupled receptors family 1 profile domain-containing protein n=1 Tax=Pocillopora damicornis TaxID=46731 RepID=A0A3M6UX87_POCDA|nr:hypothetical protein pdam_00000209 [Pocillopora damicornis]